MRDHHPDQQLGRTGHGHFLCFGFRVSASFFFSIVIRSSLDVRVWMFLVNVGTGSLLNCHSVAFVRLFAPRRMPHSCPKRALAGTSEACSASSTTSHSQPGMISFQPRRHAVDEARRAAVRRVADWVEQALPEEERHTTHVMVNQVECREDGCPPMECVIALLRKPKIIFRVRPRHACIAMRCCPRPCTKGVHALTQRSLSSHGCCVVACAVLQARGRGDTGRGVDRAERHTARGKAIRSRPPRAPRARACRCA